MGEDNDFAGVNFFISHLVSSDRVLMRPSLKATPPSPPFPPPTVVVSKAFCESAAGQHLFVGNERLGEATPRFTFNAFLLARADGNAALTFFLLALLFSPEDSTATTGSSRRGQVLRAPLLALGPTALVERVRWVININFL